MGMSDLPNTASTSSSTLLPSSIRRGVFVLLLFIIPTFSFSALLGGRLTFFSREYKKVGALWREMGQVGQPCIGQWPLRLLVSRYVGISRRLFTFSAFLLSKKLRFIYQENLFETRREKGNIKGFTTTLSSCKLPLPVIC